MVSIKPLGDVARKWAEVTPGRAAFYEAGIRAPRTPWAAAAAAAEANQIAGSSAAAARKAYSAGVRKAGDEKWSRKSLAVGPGRFAEGARAAQPDYESGFGRFHSAIASASLPPRGPKGDARNYARVQAIGDALHKLKLTGGA